jgi:hypothetical protein
LLYDTLNFKMEDIILSLVFKIYQFKQELKEIDGLLLASSQKALKINLANENSSRRENNEIVCLHSKANNQVKALKKM